MSKKVNLKETINNLHQWQEQERGRAFISITGGDCKDEVTVMYAGSTSLLGATILAAMIRCTDLRRLILAATQIFTNIAKSEGRIFRKLKDQMDEADAEYLIRQVLEEETALCSKDYNHGKNNNRQI